MIINSFTGKYKFLSNFVYSPFTFNGSIWATVEHYFQAMKTNNSTYLEMIRLARCPSVAKQIGRKVILRSDWEQVKVKVMRRAVYSKFSQISSMKEKLLGTENILLIEGNTWHDNIWGDCKCEKCKDTLGQNLLGKILMEVREELIKRRESDV